MTGRGELSRLGKIGIAAGVVVVAAFVGVCGAVLLFGRGETICRGVTVGGIDVSGLTTQQAAQRLGGWWQSRSAQAILVTALDARRTLTLRELGAQFDPQAAAAEAHSVGRVGGIFHRARLMLSQESPEKKLDAAISLSDKHIRHAVAGIARLVNKPHKDASLRVVGRQFVVVPEHLGIKVDETRAAQVLREALLDGKSLVPLPVDEDKPDVTTADVDHIDTLLATFTTQFNPGKVDRTHNLRLASAAVSGVILKPGQVFSYNDTVGPRLMSRGYRNAPIFVRGNLEPGLGGGCCQVSSTIYNAILLAGLKVVERSHHSRTVPYVKPGRDATVAFGLRDFKFENSNANPIGLIAIVKGSLLTVDVYGAAEDKKQIQIYTGDVSYRAAATKTVVDRTLKPGARQVVDHGSPGASVVVYRKVTNPDGTTTTEVVSRDRYPSQARVVAVGPAEVAAAEPTAAE